MNYSSIGVCFVVAFLVYRLVNYIWLRPKKLEKWLRQQGFRGKPYRLLASDHIESTALIAKAMSAPLALNDDIKHRVIPHVLQIFNDHGKNSFVWEGRIPRLIITKPELIREILSKYNKFHKNLRTNDPISRYFQTGIASLDGEPWSHRRRILNSSFHFEKLKLMVPAFYLSCLEMVTKWEEKASISRSIEVEVHSDLQTLTGDIISRTLFGSRFQECEKIFELITKLQLLAWEAMRSSSYIPGWNMLKMNRQMKKVDKEASDSIMEIINKKMKEIKGGESTSTSSSDFLGILLESNQFEQNKNEKCEISIDDIISECKLFYFAGQESTSTLLSWTLFLLSQYPDWQARAREEVLRVFGNSKPDYDGINRLKIVSTILYEVLRLYPPGVELRRYITEDTEVGELFFPAGVRITLPTLVLHYDPKFWGEDVKEFKPERFSKEAMKATKRPGSYFPFSMGPRVCIGQNYAMLEAKMALALILPRFTFELSPSYIHAPFTLVTLQPQFGVPLILHKL